MSDKSYNILLVDDDKDILEINRKFLEKQNCNVKTAISASLGLTVLSTWEADCIVLDVMMPKVNGFSACKKYRSITNSPIIFLTGRTSEDDKIKGFELGADDYLEKPYSLRELHVRILANIRRYQAYNTPSEMTLGGLSIDVAAHKAYCDDEEILLSNREFELLYLLVRNKNDTVTFEDIGVSMFGIYSEKDRRSVMVHMSRLRKRLESYPDIAAMVQTVWSKGYKFVTN